MDDFFLTKLIIKRIRHLHDIKVSLSENKCNHLIFTGKNGSGKTSVLSNVHANISNHLTEKKTSVITNDLDLYFSTTPDFLTKKITFIYFSAKRKAEFDSPKGIIRLNLPEKGGIIQDVGKNFLQYLVNLRAEKSFSSEEGDAETAKRIKLWFDKFETSLKFLFDDNTLRLDFDRKVYNFNICLKNRDSFNFNGLSDGYAAVINILTEILLRSEAFQINQQDMQGIVLIDEIETHLHLDLQKKILPFFTNFFPKMQFIVSTHSPFVINSISNAVIYDLEKNIRIEDVSSVSYDGLVESYFDIDKYSANIKDKLARYANLCEQVSLSTEEQTELLEARLALKDMLCPQLAPELTAEFQRLELLRKSRHDQS